MCLCPTTVCILYHHVSQLLSSEMTSLSAILTLEVSALSSSLSLEESHTVRIHFYGDEEGIIPTLELYLEVFLTEEYRIDHFVILDHAPFILEAELYLYFTSDGLLAERFPPRLIDWEQRAQAILDSIHDLTALLED